MPVSIIAEGKYPIDARSQSALRMLGPKAGGALMRRHGNWSESKAGHRDVGGAQKWVYGDCQSGKKTAT